MPKLSANYLTVNPDGTVGAQFAGGVAIVSDSGNDYSYANPKTQKSVSWHQDTVNGALVAAISVHSPAPAVVAPSGIDVTAITPDGLSRASLNTSVQSGGSPLAQLLALATTSGPPGEKYRIIFDGSYKSDFLQLVGAGGASAARMSIAGTQQLTFPAGATETNAVNLASPAGTVSAVGGIATPNTYPGVGRIIGAHMVNGGTFFQLIAETNTAYGVNTNINVSYMAWFN